MIEKVIPQETRLQPSTEAQENSSEGQIDQPKIDHPNHDDCALKGQNDDNLSIFAERFALFTNQFGETCVNENIDLALAVVVDPQCPGKPHVFYRGQIYEVAQLTRELLVHFSDEVMRSLKV